MRALAPKSWLYIESFCNECIDRRVVTATAPIPALESLAALGLAAAFVSAGLIVLLRPILVRYALARPNARSSHREPTPQGGGIAVIAAIILVIAGLMLAAPTALREPLQLAILFCATCGLAVLGAIDDVRPLSATLRLVLQFAAVAVVVVALPVDLRAVPQLPWWLERGAFVIGGVWFVNLVNFMDGIDWITVAEVAPITAALTVFGSTGALPSDAIVVAIALFGGVIGFAPFNRPVARLFLGDVGSLPIGLLLTWLLIMLAGHGHLSAAVLLPLYYLIDSTVTLLRRFARGEPLMKAHRGHFYQRALDNGFTVPEVVARVFLVNLILIGLAAVTLDQESKALHLVALATGCAVVVMLLINFSRKKQ